MELALGIGIGIIIVVIFYFLRRESFSKEPARNDSFLLIQNQINEINRLLDARLGDLSKISQNQLSENSKIVREVTEKLTRLDETNKQVVSFADQLRNLQDILKSIGALLLASYSFSSSSCQDLASEWCKSRSLFP